jgi:hypothetical protein
MPLKGTTSDCCGAIDDLTSCVVPATVALIGTPRRRVIPIRALPTTSPFWRMAWLAVFSRQERRTEPRIVNSIEPIDLGLGQSW